MNILVTMCFSGTNYHGFQVQKNAITVCEEVQNAMEKLFGTRPDIKGCSRTDSGVHAKKYCFSFCIEKTVNVNKLPLALNSFLPQDIRVIKAEEVAGDFHARYSCKAKTYEYVILNSHIDNPFKNGCYYRVPYKLDVEKMQAAAYYYIGEHNFASFMSKNSDIENTVRKVLVSKVEQRGDFIVFTVKANGFLYNMVRIMAGTLLWAGKGRISPEETENIIKSKNRENAGNTLPPQGLFLLEVDY